MHTASTSPRWTAQIAWDTLFSNTRPEVIMQMDIGNCASGGGDPIGTLRRFPNRARSVHLKDYRRPVAEFGDRRGQGGLAEIFRLCETEQNTEWYVVEEGATARVSIFRAAAWKRFIRWVGRKK